MQAGNDSSRLGWRWSPLGSTASGYRGRYVQSFQTFYQGFAERCSMLPVSCSRRVRRASMPPGQSFARRPCLAISVLIFSDLCKRPSRFQPGTLPTELVCINGQSAPSVDASCEEIAAASCRRSSVQTVSTTLRINALRAFNIGMSANVPPDLKRFHFGHVHCPAVSRSN